MIDFNYLSVPITERLPDLGDLVNDKLILLDASYNVLRVVNVGLLTDWDYISTGAVYWLEKTETLETGF